MSLMPPIEGDETVRKVPLVYEFSSVGQNPNVNLYVPLAQLSIFIKTSSYWTKSAEVTNKLCRTGAFLSCQTNRSFQRRRSGIAVILQNDLVVDDINKQKGCTQEAGEFSDTIARPEKTAIVVITKEIRT